MTLLTRFPMSKRTVPEKPQGRVKLMVVLVLLRLPSCGPIDVPTAEAFWTIFMPSQIGRVPVVPEVTGGRQCYRLRSVSISLKTSPDATDAPVARWPEARLLQIRGVPRRRHRSRGSEVFLKYHRGIYILTAMEAAVSRGVVAQRLMPLQTPNWRCR